MDQEGTKVAIVAHSDCIRLVVGPSAVRTHNFMNGRTAEGAVLVCLLQLRGTCEACTHVTTPIEEAVDGQVTADGADAIRHQSPSGPAYCLLRNWTAVVEALEGTGKLLALRALQLKNAGEAEAHHVLQALQAHLHPFLLHHRQTLTTAPVP